MLLTFQKLVTRDDFPLQIPLSPNLNYPFPDLFFVRDCGNINIGGNQPRASNSFRIFVPNLRNKNGKIRLVRDTLLVQLAQLDLFL